MLTTEELKAGDHIIMPHPINEVLSIWLIEYVGIPWINRRGIRMCSIDLLGDRQVRIHCAADQEWNIDESPENVIK